MTEDKRQFIKRVIWSALAALGTAAAAGHLTLWQKEVIFSLAVLVFLTVFKLQQFQRKNCFYEVKILSLRKLATADKVFLGIMLFLLLMPITKIDSESTISRENRALAKFPPLTDENGKINSRFGSGFDSWFSDRFHGRERIIRKYHKLMAKLEYNTNRKVMNGEQGWLFFRQDGSIENFKNSRVFIDAELERILKNLGELDEWCKKRGKRLYVLIAPDKNKIYGEYYPAYIRKLNPDSKSRANQLVNYLRRNSKINVIYPLERLMAEKRQGLLYYRNDTHWTELGAYFGFQELMSLIEMDYPKLAVPEVIKIAKLQHKRGDLTNMFPADEQTDDETFYLRPQMKKISYKCPKVDLMKDEHCQNSEGQLRAVIFRDSFMESMKPYILQTFAQTALIWRFLITTDDMKYIAENADVVIIEMVERSLPHLPGVKIAEE